jgi:hypothetical protein
MTFNTFCRRQTARIKAFLDTIPTTRVHVSVHASGRGGRTPRYFRLDEMDTRGRVFRTGRRRARF